MSKSFGIFVLISKVNGIGCYAMPIGDRHYSSKNYALKVAKKKLHPGVMFFIKEYAYPFCTDDLCKFYDFIYTKEGVIKNV